MHHNDWSYLKSDPKLNLIHVAQQSDLFSEVSLLLLKHGILSKDDFFDYYYTFNVLVGFSTKVIYDGFFSDFFEVYYDLKKFEMIPVNSPLSPIKFAPYDLD